MSESGSSNLDEIKARLKDAVANAEGHVDTEGIMSRIRETVGKAGSDVDTDAIVAKVKEVAGKAEGKVDTDKLRHWIDEVDRETLKGWLDEAKSIGAGAASLVGAQGEKLADRAPGAFDKLAGAAKERLGSLTGDEGLMSEGNIERLKGQFMETIASATEMVESESKDPADAVKTKHDQGAGRG
jgi:uncharacterized protein YjbJ (UPF0337 family)